MPRAVMTGLDGREFEIECADRFRLSARWFDAAAPRAVVLVAPALAVAQDFYAPFAQALADRGLSALTFDFRGVGRSAPASLRGFRATLSDWIEQDYDAVLRAAAAPGLPVFVVGHSMGAQLPMLTRSAATVRAMVAVAGGGGYWRRLPRLHATVLLALLTCVVPEALPLAGYYPGRALRVMGDLPAGVMRQWRRWALHPDFLVGVEKGAREAYARAVFPILSLSFTDDPMMPQANIDALHSHLTRAPREYRRLSPADARGPIGHVGFFRRRHRDTLWPIAIDWLLARADDAGAPASAAA